MIGNQLLNIIDRKFCFYKSKWIVGSYIDPNEAVIFTEEHCRSCLNARVANLEYGPNYFITLGNDEYTIVIHND